MLQNAAKNQEKDYKSYMSDDLSLGYHMVKYEVKGNVWNVHVSPMIAQPIAMLSFCLHICPHDEWFNNTFLQIGSTTDTQLAHQEGGDFKSHHENGCVNSNQAFSLNNQRYAYHPKRKWWDENGGTTDIPDGNTYYPYWSRCGHDGCHGVQVEVMVVLQMVHMELV